MAARTSRTSLPFNRSFKLEGIEGELRTIGAVAPEQETVEARPPEVVLPVATFLHIHRDGASQVVTVNATELELLFHEGVLVPLDRMEPADGLGWSQRGPGSR
jgi:hypothetical protein